MSEIPSLKESLNYDEINQVIINNYSTFTKEYTTFLSEWLTDTNKIFMIYNQRLFVCNFE